MLRKKVKSPKGGPAAVGKAKKPIMKKKPVTAEESEEDLGSSDMADDSEEEEITTAKVTPGKKTALAAKNGGIKMDDADEDEDDDEEEIDDDDDEEEEEDDDESDLGDDDEEEETQKTVVQKKPEAKKSVIVKKAQNKQKTLKPDTAEDGDEDEEDDLDDGSDEEDEEEMEDSEAESNEGEDDSEEEDDSEAKTKSKKRKLEAKKGKTAKKAKVDPIECSVTIRIANLPAIGVTEESIIKMFKKKEVIVAGVRFGSQESTCFVDLENPKDIEKAISLNGRKYKGQELVVRRDSSIKNPNFADGTEMFVKNLPFNSTVEKIEAELTKLFPKGINIRIPTNDRGVRGWAYVQFNTKEEVLDTIKENQGLEMSGRALKMEVAGVKATTAALFVKNLSLETTLETLTAAFGAKDGHLLTFPDTGKPKGMAYLDFTSQEEADEALKKMTGKEIDGQEVQVMPKRKDRGRGGYRGGGRGGFGRGGGGYGRGGGGGFGRGRGGGGRGRGGFGRGGGGRGGFGRGGRGGFRGGRGH